MGVGAADEEWVGKLVGSLVKYEGSVDGAEVGCRVGKFVGEIVGKLEGCSVKLGEKLLLGLRLGADVGDAVELGAKLLLGLTLGAALVTEPDGCSVGAGVGLPLACEQLQFTRKLNQPKDPVTAFVTLYSST